MNTCLSDKYINSFTDLGFKKLFGKEVNKGLFLDFMNELLREQEGTIKNLTTLLIKFYYKISVL
ncbi:MAG: PD-(D/E)XK nuclease family transposase [Flavobacteriaceae bacterium]|nr:PD-(D/E)XK nuclease family transposase [Flavobacteriaceae bacterium]